MDADNFCSSFLKSESTAGGADNKPVFSIVKNLKRGANCRGSELPFFLCSPLLERPQLHALERLAGPLAARGARTAARGSPLCARGEGMRLSLARARADCA